MTITHPPSPPPIHNLKRNKQQHSRITTLLNKPLTTLLLLLLLLTSLPPTTLSLEAKWTPNETSPDDSGPLPLSMNQRQQLLQLEQTISNSSNPRETLSSIARSNNMSPEELENMLARNRRDLESGAAQNMPQGGGGGGVVRNVWRDVGELMVGVVGMVGGYARSHPRRMSLIGSFWVLFLYVWITAPRTGIVISQGSSLISGGHSTVLKPPVEYLDNYLSSRRLIRQRRRGFSFVGEYDDFISERLGDDVAAMKDNGLTNEKVGRKGTSKYSKNMSLFLTSRKRLSFEPFLENEDDDPTETISVLYKAATAIFSSRRFAEFSPRETHLFRQARWELDDDDDDDDETTLSPSPALLVMKKMGDWGRYGIQPLDIITEEQYFFDDKNGEEEEEEEDQRRGKEARRTLLYGSLKGGHWDGILRLSVERDDTGVILSASLIIPKKGRKISQKISEKLLTSLIESISTSTLTEAKKTIAMMSQSSSYRRRFELNENQRRKSLAEKERLIEEMSRNRKRRWMRGFGNENGGHYRPSGERMRSPNNC